MAALVSSERTPSRAVEDVDVVGSERMPRAGEDVDLPTLAGAWTMPLRAGEDEDAAGLGERDDDGRAPENEPEALGWPRCHPRPFESKPFVHGQGHGDGGAERNAPRPRRSRAEAQAIVAGRPSLVAARAAIQRL